MDNEGDMKITTRGRYGLRAMLELARGFRGPPVLMSTVAEREGISRKYLHALLSSLKSAGLVRGIRGAGGGFELTRPPAEIRLDEVLRAVEGPLCLVDCVADPGKCGRAAGCKARQVWQELSDTVAKALHDVTLQRLIDEPSRRTRSHGRQERRRPKAARGRSR